MAVFAGVLVSLSDVDAGDELSRKSKTPREEYPNVDVIYDFVTGPDGERLRTIITKPHGQTGKLPVIFVAGWLSCDTVESPPDKEPGPGVVHHDATGLAFRELAKLPGFVFFRMDKQGCGDSEGNCAETDFDSELAGYRVAFRTLKKYDFIDPDRVYIFGISNGGGFAPLIPETEAEQHQVRGYIIVGAWVKTWFEHMLEIERRRFGLMGKSPGEVNDRMRRAATLYHDWLIKNKDVDQILRGDPALSEIWPEGKDHAHLYGRPLAFYQQLQKLNLGAAWARVKVPALVLHGQFDWIMSRDDHELIAQFVNANQFGAAKFIEVPEMGHTFQHYLSLPDAFHGKEAPFDPKTIQLAIEWLNEQKSKNTGSASLEPAGIDGIKHPLAVAEFRNETEEKILDGTLKQVLRMAFDESPFFDLLAESESNANAVSVAGTIAKRNGLFVIELKVTTGPTGQLLAEEHVNAKNRQDVVRALGEATEKLRTDLGEPAESVKQFSTPLETATTSSLEALQSWGLRLEAKQSRGPAAAVPFLQKAIQRDPDFATALFDLGLIYRNAQQESRARDLFVGAFALHDRATVRRRYAIDGMYHSFVKVEYDPTLEAYHEWMRGYPKDERPVSNLGSFYGDVCEYDKAIAQFKKARQMNPKNFIVHENLVELLTAAGRFHEAREAYSEMMRSNLDDDAPHVYLFAVAFLENDEKEMAKQVAWFDGKTDVQHEILSEQADAEAYKGHLAKARELTKRAVESALKVHNKEQAAAWLLNAAWREELFGNLQPAHDQAVRAMEIAGDSREGEAVAAILFARTGDVARATGAAEDLNKRYPDHPVVQSFWIPCIQAQIALTQKSPGRALQLLQPAARYDSLLPQVGYYSPMPSVVLRAEAYAATDQPGLAAKEWEKILNTPGIVQLSASAPIARLRLAQSYAKQNEKVRTATAYKDFLSLWNKADAGIPVLTQAKEEFSRLESCRNTAAAR
jgi:pimeloyl-ACP methyl ester carboxylesterase/tetratricopeptide (TPR) repeat protein